MADRSSIGKTGKPFKMPIEWSKVREFARAIKDPNPLYFDPELAKKEAAASPCLLPSCKPPRFGRMAIRALGWAVSISGASFMASRNSSS